MIPISRNSEIVDAILKEAIFGIGEPKNNSFWLCGRPGNLKTIDRNSKEVLIAVKGIYTRIQVLNVEEDATTKDKVVSFLITDLETHKPIKGPFEKGSHHSTLEQWKENIENALISQEEFKTINKSYVVGNDGNFSVSMTMGKEISTIKQIPVKKGMVIEVDVRSKVHGEYSYSVKINKAAYNCTEKQWKENAKNLNLTEQNNILEK